MATIVGWSPGVFWSSTPHELFAAIEGWKLSNDGGQTAKKRAFAEFKAGLESAGVA